GEGTVGPRQFSVADAERDGSVRRLQGLAKDEAAAPPKVPVEIDRRVGERSALLGRQRAYRFAVDIDKAGEFHGDRPRGSVRRSLWSSRSAEFDRSVHNSCIAGASRNRRRELT